MIQTVDLWYWKQNALPTEPQPLPGANVYVKKLWKGLIFYPRLECLVQLRHTKISLWFLAYCWGSHWNHDVVTVVRIQKVKILNLTSLPITVFIFVFSKKLTVLYADGWSQTRVL